MKLHHAVRFDRISSTWLDSSKMSYYNSVYYPRYLRSIGKYAFGNRRKNPTIQTDILKVSEIPLPGAASVDESGKHYPKIEFRTNESLEILTGILCAGRIDKQRQSNVVVVVLPVLASLEEVVEKGRMIITTIEPLFNTF